MRYCRPLIVTLTCAMASSSVPSRLLLRVDHRADIVDRRIKPAGDFAIGGFQLARTGGLGIQRGGEPRAVAAEGLELVAERGTAAVGLDPAIKGGVQRIERQGETTGGRVDQALIGHRSTSCPLVRPLCPLAPKLRRQSLP